VIRGLIAKGLDGLKRLVFSHGKPTHKSSDFGFERSRKGMG
jgi:hypothetical protein